MSQEVNGFEIFSDPSYFDMWAVRRIGEVNFYKTQHFNTLEDAIASTKD